MGVVRRPHRGRVLRTVGWLSLVTAQADAICGSAGAGQCPCVYRSDVNLPGRDTVRVDLRLSVLARASETAGAAVASPRDRSRTLVDAYPVNSVVVIRDVGVPSRRS